MALPFVALLAPRVRALLPIIRGGVAQGLTITALNNVIKAAQGKGLRRQVLADTMRAVRGVEQRSTFLKYLNKNSIPNINRLPRAITRIRRKLSFIVQVTGLQVDSGLEIKQFVTVALDNVLTRESIESLAAQAIEDNYGAYKLEVTSALIQSGSIAGDAGTL